MAGKEISGPAFLCGVVVGLPSYMTEPHLEIGAAFPDSPVRLWIAAYAKLAPVGAQTSNAAIAGTGRLLEASPYFRHWFCI